MYHNVGETSSHNDVSGLLTVFIITNGRSTYDYCHKALEASQGALFKYKVIRDKGWLEANQSILDECETPYFVRVDDDMLVHPRCIEYMAHCVSNENDKKIALRQWKLWEFYSDKPIRSIKMYSRDLARKIGFRINHLGKIDKTFRQDCVKDELKIQSYKDIIAVHSCGEVDEHLEYAKMRGEHKGEDFEKKARFIKNSISKLTMDLDAQYGAMHKKLMKEAKKDKSDFYYWIQKYV